MKFDSFWKMLITLMIAAGLSACASNPLPPEAPLAGKPSGKTVVFIHGMYLTPLVWQPWERYFQEQGYQTLAPAWPLHDISVYEQQSNHPRDELAFLKLDQVLDHYRKLISNMDHKPVLIGHSMGGLIVQLLLQEGYGSAGVAISSAPPQGLISLKWSFLKSNWGVINPLADIDEPIELTFEQIQYGFVNGLPLAEQKAVFERHIVPESRRIGKATTQSIAEIDFDKPRSPLLLIAGDADRIIPASLNEDNYDAYDDSPSMTAFKVFPNRTHWIIGQQGWDEVADYVAVWLKGANR